eukprot:s1486_g7.t1
MGVEGGGTEDEEVEGGGADVSGGAGSEESPKRCLSSATCCCSWVIVCWDDGSVAFIGAHCWMYSATTLAAYLVLPMLEVEMVEWSHVAKDRTKECHWVVENEMDWEWED